VPSRRQGPQEVDHIIGLQHGKRGQLIAGHNCFLSFTLAAAEERLQPFLRTSKAATSATGLFLRCDTRSSPVTLRGSCRPSSAICGFAMRLASRPSGQLNRADIGMDG
jgi:hypothetical protein